MFQPDHPPIPATNPILQGAFLLGDGLEDCDAQACRIWGLTREAARGKSLLNLSPPWQPDGSSSQTALEGRLAAVREGLAQAFEWRFLGDAGEIDTLVYLEPPDGQGRIRGRVRDLVGITSTQAALRESESRLQLILDNTPAAVYLKDREGRYLVINRRFLQIVQKDEQDILGRQDIEVFPEDVAGNLRENDARILSSRKAAEFEEQMQIDGETRTFLSIKFPLLSADSDPYAVCGISTDITDRKRIEGALCNVALGVSAATGQNVFEEIVRHLTAALGVDFAYVGKLVGGDSPSLQTLAVCHFGQIVDNTAYQLEGTPCSEVVGQQFHYVPCGVQFRYPGDNMLKHYGFDGYAGYPLFDSNGNALGLIAVTHCTRLPPAELTESMLKIFSVRAASELERLQTDEARRVSEESYRAIFDASEDSIFVHDIETDAIVDVNPKACATYGYTYDELLHIDIGMLSSGEHPYTVEEAAKYVQQAAEGKPQRIEWRRRNKDGTLHWDEVFLKRATIAGIDRVVAFTREITKRKEAEEALRASEEQYRSIFNSSVDGLILLSAKGRIVDVNPAYLRMHGYNKHELLGLDPRSLENENGLCYQNCLETVFSGQPFHAETIARRKDGGLFDVEVHGVEVHYQGKPHLLAIVRDISERRERELALAKSEDQLRATVEAALDCIIGMDCQGNIIEFNPAAEACFGYSREEVIGRPLADFLIPERSRAAHRHGLAKYPDYIEGGGGPFLGRRVDITAMRADGSEFPAELAIGVAKGAEDDIFIGYLRDITERKRAEVDRSRLEAQLRQAQKMEAIGHLSGGIAHDFNNILTGIMGYLVLAQERVEKFQDEKLAKYLGRANQSGLRARDLIQQMLTFSRGQRGEPRPLALQPLIKESARLLQTTFPSSVELHTTLDESLPTVMADPVQIEQVLMNLCINARDAMGGIGSIRVSLRRVECNDGLCTSCKQTVGGRFVELAVGDEGPGIPVDLHDRIFEPFFTTKDVGKGSGMGLSTVHGILHEYGAHIILETGPDKGALFRVLFPAMEDQQTVPAAPNEPLEADAEKTRLAGRVLVVDDDDAAGGFMEDLFESWGLQADLVMDALRARDIFTLHPDRYDLVVLDQTMPRMTGMELSKDMIAVRPDIPVILYTGYAENLDETRLKTAGIRVVVRKPVDTQALFEIMRDLLTTAR